jgi:hypothetical protein
VSDVNGDCNVVERNEDDDDDDDDDMDDDEPKNDDDLDDVGGDADADADDADADDADADVDSSLKKISTFAILFTKGEGNPAACDVEAIIEDDAGAIDKSAVETVDKVS